jgi:hypothetical protein
MSSIVSSSNGFEINHYSNDGNDYSWYVYTDTKNPNDQCYDLFTRGTKWLNSIVTFRPANIPGALTMNVDTHRPRHISLPRSIDVWEVKYYSSFWYFDYPEPKKLKNSGIFNLREITNQTTLKHIYMELSLDQYLSPGGPDNTKYYIPDVD